MRACAAGRTILVCLTALCLAAASVCRVRPACGQQAAAAPPASGLRIAVVDTAGVLRQSAQWRDGAQERAREMEKMRRVVSKLTSQVQVLRNEYENLPPDTEARSAKAREVEAAMAELERTRREAEAQATEDYNQAVRTMFRAIGKAVADHARENGIHVVLKKQDLELKGPESIEQNLLLATTEVLFADPALEITDDVVARLNAGYPGPLEVK